MGEGGVVRDPRVRRDVLESVLELFCARGLVPEGVCASPITGAKGNVEFFMLGALDAGANDIQVASARVRDAIREVCGA